MKDSTTNRSSGLIIEQQELSIAMKSLLQPALITAATLLQLAACSSQSTKLPAQRYVPVSRTIVPLGELHLSNSLMGFSALKGEMKLQYVGQMPESAGENLVGASVYRVKNWQPYFKQNAGTEAWCSEPPRWVTVNSDTGAPAWSREISIGLLTLEDWSKYSPNEHRSCASGKYVRASDR